MPEAFCKTDEMDDKPDESVLCWPLPLLSFFSIIETLRLFLPPDAEVFEAVLGR